VDGEINRYELRFIQKEFGVYFFDFKKETRCKISIIEVMKSVAVYRPPFTVNRF